MSFGRVITAMVTPFNEHFEMDLEKTGRLMDYLFESGTDDLVLAGTTGESATLKDEEKLELFSFARAHCKGRGKLIAATGTNNTEKSVQLSRAAARTGVDGLLLVVPYYNKPSQEGLYQHFKAIANSVDLPIMLYNVPGRTVANLTPETVARLARIENIVALKEASKDLVQVTRILSLTNGELTVYSGDDSHTLPMLAIGGKGVVSVASHVVGKEMQRMIKAYLEGMHEEAAELHRQLVPLFEAMFYTASPAPLKFLLNQLHVDVGPVRLPLVGLSESEATRVMAAYQMAVPSHFVS